ncbi:MAG: hypothetical protein LC797_13910 [Chloroflexi bacterium]|nr:hypothetical protein [Chloroflexota bacterium]
MDGEQKRRAEVYRQSPGPDFGSGHGEHPSRFSTCVITDGILPSLHVEYKRCHIKQYFKRGRALRTETTFNNTYDFRIGRV